ncbi:MAG: hypothetical protein ABI162_06840 [Luteolibacter sp.]
MSRYYRENPDEVISHDWISVPGMRIVTPEPPAPAPDVPGEKTTTEEQP